PTAPPRWTHLLAGVAIEDPAGVLERERHSALIGSGLDSLHQLLYLAKRRRLPRREILDQVGIGRGRTQPASHFLKSRLAIRNAELDHQATGQARREPGLDPFELCRRHWSRERHLPAALEQDVVQ